MTRVATNKGKLRPFADGEPDFGLISRLYPLPPRPAMTNSSAVIMHEPTSEAVPSLQAHAHAWSSDAQSNMVMPIAHADSSENAVGATTVLSSTSKSMPHFHSHEMGILENDEARGSTMNLAAPVKDVTPSSSERAQTSPTSLMSGVASTEMNYEPYHVPLSSTLMNHQPSYQHTNNIRNSSHHGPSPYHSNQDGSSYHSLYPTPTQYPNSWPPAYPYQHHQAYFPPHSMNYTPTPTSVPYNNPQYYGGKHSSHSAQGQLQPSHYQPDSNTSSASCQQETSYCHGLEPIQGHKKHESFSEDFKSFIAEVQF